MTYDLDPQFRALVVGPRGGVDYSEINTTRVYLEPIILAVYPKVHVMDKRNCPSKIRPYAGNSCKTISTFKRKNEIDKDNQQERLLIKFNKILRDFTPKTVQTVMIKSDLHGDMKLTLMVATRRFGILDRKKMNAVLYKDNHMLETPLKLLVLQGSKNLKDKDNQQERPRMLKCRLCNYETASVLSNHLSRTHNMYSKEYLELFPGEEIVSKEYVARGLATRKETWIKKYGVPYPKEDMSAARNGLRLLEEKLGVSNIAFADGVGEKKAVSMKATCLSRYGVENPGRIPGVRAKYKALRRKQMMDPIYREKLKVNRKGANKAETELASLLPQFFFVGDGSLWIECINHVRNPDFISFDGNTIIELIGPYWHDERTKSRTLKEEVETIILDYLTVGKRVYILNYLDWNRRIQKKSILTEILTFLESSETLRYQVSYKLKPMIKSDLHGDMKLTPEEVIQEKAQFEMAKPIPGHLKYPHMLETPTKRSLPKCKNMSDRDNQQGSANTEFLRDYQGYTSGDSIVRPLVEARETLRNIESLPSLITSEA